MSFLMQCIADKGEFPGIRNHCNYLIGTPAKVCWANRVERVLKHLRIDLFYINFEQKGSKDDQI